MDKSTSYQFDNPKKSLTLMMAGIEDSKINFPSPEDLGTSPPASLSLSSSGMVLPREDK